MVCGYDTGHVTRLEKENADLKAQMDKSQVGLEYDLQAKCSKDAKTWFNENWSDTARDKNTSLLNYNNHYNKVSNKYFIFVEYHLSQGTGGSWVNDMNLWDVYENSKYGSFTESHFIGYKGESRDTVMSCEVTGQRCKTLDQFNGLIQPYLNN
jgi:hypothetical protein